MNYSIGQYFNQDTGRKQWAVYSEASQTWYFASKYGKKAATSLL